MNFNEQRKMSFADWTCLAFTNPNEFRKAYLENGQTKRIANEMIDRLISIITSPLETYSTSDSEEKVKDKILRNCVREEFAKALPRIKTNLEGEFSKIFFKGI